MSVQPHWFHSNCIIYTYVIFSAWGQFSFNLLCPVPGRSQCHVLPVSRLHHLPQLGPSEDTDVLAGPKSTLCHPGSRYHGKDGFETLSSEPSEQVHTTFNTICWKIQYVIMDGRIEAKKRLLFQTTRIIPRQMFPLS